MMSIVGFTHTATDLAPPADPFAPNNNISIPPLSFFWGGAITDHIGALAQLTYNQAPPAADIGSNPFVHAWSWDNTDVRYADLTTLGKMNITYGITANNSPTVQDPWNTMPAWGFPYAVSPFSAGFGPTPIIDGAFAAHVGSVGGYVYINDLIYLEASVYRSLSPGAQNALGVDPFDEPGLFNAAPYWRAAIEPHWGPHWLEVGTFGMAANVHPFVNPGTQDTSIFSQTDKFTDIGFDAQYQYQGSNFWFTLRGSLIHEIQKLDATSQMELPRIRKMNSTRRGPTHHWPMATTTGSSSRGNISRAGAAQIRSCSALTPGLVITVCPPTAGSPRSRISRL